MGRLIDIEVLRKEIERREETAKTLNTGVRQQPDQFVFGLLSGYGGIKDFLDDLPDEKPLPGTEDNSVPGRDYVPVEWVETLGRYGKWKIVRTVEKPVDLDEAAVCIFRFLDTYAPPSGGKTRSLQKQE